MQEYSTGERNLAAAYAFIAGFVDSVGFLFLGGVFLSFMSGNTTRLATATVEGNADMALLAGSALVLFLIGIMQGALIRRLAVVTLPIHRVREVVMANMCVIFTLSSIMLLIDQPRIAVLFLSLGIGAMNSIFERGGEVSIPLTYMTGTLVKMGQRFVDAFFGGTHAAWLSHLKMWAGLTSGAFVGAVTYHRIGLHAILVSTALTLAVSLIAFAFRSYGRRHGVTVRQQSEPF